MVAIDGDFMKKYLILILALLLVTGCDININLNSNNLIDTREVEEKVSDDNLVQYVEDVNEEIDNVNDKNTLKNTFITLTDFIFYDGEIKGKKFSELKDDSKEEILVLYEKIDMKIESKFPNYKENISDSGKKTYNNVKDKVTELRDKFKTEHSDIYDQYEEGKNNMSDVYSEYEPYIEEGKEKSKEVYNKAKDKVSSWYKEYKES